MTTTIAGIPGLKTFTFYTDTAGQGVTGHVRRRSTKWVNSGVSGKDIAAADVFLLSDSAGNGLIGKKAVYDGDDINDGIYDPGVPSDGFTVTTMGGGVCYIVFDRE